MYRRIYESFMIQLPGTSIYLICITSNQPGTEKEAEEQTPREREALTKINE